MRHPHTRRRLSRKQRRRIERERMARHAEWFDRVMASARDVRVERPSAAPFWRWVAAQCVVWFIAGIALCVAERLRR